MSRLTLTDLSIFLPVLLLVASACSGSQDPSGESGTEDESVRIVVVTHGQAADPNWSVFQSGVQEAGAHAGVRVEYQAPESFDMVTMGQQIDAALASDPDGMVVTIPDADALDEPIRSVIEAGIPVISANSGSVVSDSLGALLHVGQPEYEAGFRGGERLAEIGVESAFCVNMEVGNVALDRRCEGVADALSEAGGSSRVLAVELGDPTETQQRVQAALSSNPEVDGLITLGPTAAGPTLQALENTDRGEAITLATFDLSEEIFTAIEAGRIAFAVDQQFFLQGYLPVTLLALHVRRNHRVRNDVIATGPRFVTSDNVDQIRTLRSARTGSSD